MSAATAIESSNGGSPAAELPEETDIVVIGAGFSGLGTAIRLKQEDYRDFVVLERGDDVGGTWHFNTYPNCGCDVPSHLYSFSFAPNPAWTRTYSKQPEIRAYLRRTADKFGVRPYIKTGTTVETARWDEEAGRWEVKTDRGTIRARILIAGMGPLAEPRIPDIEGLEDFEGKVMHSARWDHSYSLEGKRVASIGTGASAIQYVPAIQPEVEQLDVYQRTPPWIMPHTDRPTSFFERSLYKAFPAAERLLRGGVYAARETLVTGFVKQPKLMKLVEQLAKQHIRSSISSKELREKVTPNYTIGCKRILPSNRWYPAIDSDNVDLITDGVARVTKDSVIDEAGNERKVDTIIFGTGFQVTDMPVGHAVTGRDGRTLDESWEGSPNAYLGTSIPGFPNLFMLLGPNTGLGHSSMIYMIESQIQHVMSALDQMRKKGADTVDVKRSAADEFKADVDKRHEGAVWNTGCASWYLDDTGRNATLWPDWTFRFRQRTAEFDPTKYDLTSHSDDREKVAA